MQLLVHKIRELLHILVGAVDDGYFKSTHASPITLSLDLEQVLDVDVVLWSYINRHNAEHINVPSFIHANKSYLFLLQELSKLWEKLQAPTIMIH
jgi:hypothetical protein